MAELTPAVTRLALSSTCENNCSYCPQVGAKKLFASTPLSAAAESDAVILACNSLFSPDLHPRLTELAQKTRSLKMEINLSTLSLERWSPAIFGLRDFPLGLVAVIDKWDPAKISALEKFDGQIVEYRIVPSRIYPAGLFLRELPGFVLKKATWSFMLSEAGRPPFPSADELQDTLSTLEKSQFGALPQSPTQHYEELTRYVSTLGPLENPTAVWISKTPGPGERNYLEKLAAHLEPRTVFYFAGDAERGLSGVIKKRRTSGKDFYFFENLLMPVGVWKDFLGSPSADFIDHFSWNEFLEERRITVRQQPGLSQEKNPVSTAAGLAEFSSQCQKRYARRPDSAFYGDFFCFLTANSASRRLALGFFTVVLGLLTGLPGGGWQKIKNFFGFFSRQASDRLFDAGEAAETAAKGAAKAGHWSYWAVHSFYWRLFQFRWRVNDVLWELSEGFWFAYRLAWKTTEGFWLAYHLAWKTTEVYWFFRRFYGAALPYLWKSTEAFWFVYRQAWRLTEAYWFCYRQLGAVNRAYWFCRRLYARTVPVALNKVFWFCYRQCWKLSEVYWFGRRLHGRMIPLFWKTTEGFWLAYHWLWKSTEIFWLAYHWLWKSTEIFWLAYHWLWKSTEVFWFCAEIFWRVSDGYWWLYRKYISPVTGFLAALFEFPESYNSEPLGRRLFLKSKLVARKWGWLVLKMAGARRAPRTTPTATTVPR